MKPIKLAIFCFFLSSAFANTYTPQSSLPIEFRHLIESLNRHLLKRELSEAFEKSYEEKILTLDKSFQSLLDKANLYFLLKSEIYKSIFEYFSQTQRPFSLSNQKALKILTLKKKELTKEADSFSKWMIEELIGQFQKLVFSMDKLKAQKKSLPYLKLEKSAKIMAPAIHFLLKEQFSSIHQALAPLKVKIFDNIYTLSKALPELAKLSPPKTSASELKYFVPSKPAEKKRDPIKVREGLQRSEAKQTLQKLKTDDIPKTTPSPKEAQKKWRPKEGLNPGQ